MRQKKLVWKIIQGRENQDSVGKLINPDNVRVGKKNWSEQKRRKVVGKKLTTGGGNSFHRETNQYHD